jgi:Domain of unknown function (DUF4129)
MIHRTLRIDAIVLVLALVLVRAAAAAQAHAQEPETQGEGDAEGYQYMDEGDIRQALEETLSQPDFFRLRSVPEETKPVAPKETESPGWLDRFVRWLSGLGGGGQDKDGSSSPDIALPLAGMRLLLFAMAVLILGAAIVFIAKSVLATAKDRKTAEEESAGARVFQPGAAPGEIPPDEYWRRALAHGEGKHYREGIRDLLLGAMSATERRGLIRFRKGLTNRDYFYSVRGPVRDSFARISSSFEHVYFGRRAATSDTFRECCREYQKSFGGAAS